MCIQNFRSKFGGKIFEEIYDSIIEQLIWGNVFITS